MLQKRVLCWPSGAKPKLRNDLRQPQVAGDERGVEAFAGAHVDGRCRFVFGADEVTLVVVELLESVFFPDEMVR